jgi:hypothetical protein
MVYYLFAGGKYYAKGGSRDFIKMSESIEELITLSETLTKIEDCGFPQCDWFHITDQHMNIIFRSEEQAHY